jgi:prolyl oligopeptidase
MILTFVNGLRGLFLTGGIVCAGLLGTAVHAAPAPPAPAPVQAVQDVYFGKTIVDNYRWMEAEPEPQFRAMVEVQSAYAHAVIDAIPGRDRLERDIAAMDGERTVLLTVALAHGKRFYLKRMPGSEIGKLYVNDAATGKETLLVDPETYGSAGHHATIEQFGPSQNGEFVAYTLSLGGSEQSTLHVVEAATGKVLSDAIDRADAAGVSWAPDGRSFFYTRLAKPSADAAPSARFDHQRVYRHQLGANPDTDQVVLDADHLPFAFKAAQVWPGVTITPGSEAVIAEIGDGTGIDKALFTARLADLLAGRPTWKTVAEQRDGVTFFSVHGDQIYLLTHHAAPRYQVVMESLTAPDIATAKIVAPERAGVITGIAASSEALYVAERTGGGMTLSRQPYGAAKLDRIALPFPGTIFPPSEDAGALSADPTAPGATFALESWVRPLVWLSYDPRTRAVRDTGIAGKFAADLSAYDTLETAAKAPDGTMVPLSIVFKRGVALDHSHPTILLGYGSFGVSLDPEFRPTLAPWLDRGGVYAIAHVRGGGELGEPWHQGGMLTAKQNTVTDFIACAEALIRMGYTSSEHLAAEGASAGGITVGVAITRRPELFRAALIGAGAVNALRLEQLPVGPNLIPEFGSVKNPEQFSALLAMDAYQQVRDGAPYPAVLLTDGFNDPRIQVWMPAKMTARLQAASTSGRPVLFRVDFDAGHGAGSTRSQNDAKRADELAFLLWQLGASSFQAP